LKESGTYLVYTIMVLDENKIVKLNDPIKHGPPDTQGDWGHYEVGSEKLRCHEREGRKLDKSRTAMSLSASTT
jgi:hypothetical protein